MARWLYTQLTALCAVLSFFYIFQTFEHHSLAERPRLSSILVLLLSGVLCFGASSLSKWLPGADGRFARRNYEPLLNKGFEEASYMDTNVNGPKRPRKLSLPVLVVCIVLRMEIFHRVSYQQQCATHGLESYLSMLLLAYEVYASRRKWTAPPPEDPDDPWRSVFDDIYEWFTGPRVLMTFAVLATVLFSTGTFFSQLHFTRSTYACFDLVESRRTTLLLQSIGLALDAVIIVLSWRLFAWSQTTKVRVRTLGSILVLSSLSMGLLCIASMLFSTSSHAGASISFLYGVDILGDSIAFALLVISVTLWVCETTPVVPASIITFLIGTWAASNNFISSGNWSHPSRIAALAPLWFIITGTVLFVYTHEIRYIVFFRRVILSVLLVTLLIGATIYSLAKQPITFTKRHPISDLIFRASIKHDRLMSHYSASKSLPVAIREYKERHDGRNPPPKFAEWYDLAKDTVIVDHFGQIDADLKPFQKLSPDELRKRAAAMAAYPGTQSITIKGGEASHNGKGDSSKDLEDLVNMIKKFSKHLPDMLLPINLSPTPQILPTWENANRKGHADLSAMLALVSKRSEQVSNATIEAMNVRDGEKELNRPKWAINSANAYRQMQAEGCQPGSRARSRPHRAAAKFCTSCIARYSKGQLLINWEKSLEFCAQPDLQHLHGFTLTSPHSPPIRELMPLFGGSKTEPFKDILIPTNNDLHDAPDMKWEFGRRYDSLFWRGEIGEDTISDEAIHGNHKYRLLRLINRPTNMDEVTIILPKSGAEEENMVYGYEQVSAIEADNVIPFSMAISNTTACANRNCELIKQAYGGRDESQESLEYRYVLATDEDDGPPLQLLRIIRSQSVPFVSTIFQTWYTERLTPWLHFVPIDVRYQALHTTFSYFTGTERRGTLNGRDTNLPPQPADAEWIGQQGSKWVERALGEKDREVYLFRLLLEWGRLINDKRDKIGFWQDDEGKLHGDDRKRDHDQKEAP